MRHNLRGFHEGYNWEGTGGEQGWWGPEFKYDEDGALVFLGHVREKKKRRVIPSCHCHVSLIEWE